MLSGPIQMQLLTNFGSFLGALNEKAMINKK